MAAAQQGIAPPQRFRSALGGNSQVPNVYWQALTVGQLRRYHNFVALPPVDKIVVSGPETFRYVRQQDELWWALHAGALTTGKLAGALGMREPGSARIVRGHQEPTALQDAYLHLLQPPWQPDDASSAAQPGPGGSTAAAQYGGQRGTQPLQHNEEARRQYNVHLADEAKLGEGTGQLAADAGPSEEDKRRVSEILALRGTLAVRLFWGTVQEASSLHVLLQLFPKTRLEEVGMYCMDPDLMCKEWGFQPGELPRLGASPDAVICHRLTIHPAEVGAGTRTMQQLLLESSAAVGLGRPELAVAAAARAAAEQVLHRAVEAALKLPLGDDASAAPAAGAEEVAGKLEAGDGGCGAGSLQQGWREAVQVVAERLTREFEAGSGGSGAGQQGAAEAPEASASSLHVEVREVVEVKNHCPFAFRNQVKAKKGLLQLEYRMADAGPMDQVRAAWVPQLQMHCLAAGAPSVLLLSRSATKGIRLFRIRRDDGYIRRMLQCISVLQVEHVARRVAPERGPRRDDPRHWELLQQTLAVAQAAVLLAHVQGPALRQPQGTDGNAFWGPQGRRR